MVKYIRNDKGNTYIWFIVITTIFLIISMLVFDNASIYLNSKRAKDAMNKAVKAGTLAILEDAQLADGNFKISPMQARINFNSILADNLGLDKISMNPLATGSIVTEKPIIREFVVENVTPKVYYSASLNQNFNIKNPSVFAVVDAKIRGIFSSRIITMYKLSSSQLKSIYE